MQQLERVRLDKTPDDRKKYDNLADVYAIIIQVEHLEIVWSRNCCTNEEYEKECDELILRFKSNLAAVSVYYKDMSIFFDEWAPDCHAARNRLLKVGVPATVYHGGTGKKLNDAKEVQLSVAQTVQYFITTIDGLQLSLKAVDEVHPHLKELAISLGKVSTLPSNHCSKTNVQKWLEKLNQMKASDELSEEDIRQMSFDLENSYSEFVKFLQGGQ